MFQISTQGPFLAVHKLDASRAYQYSRRRRLLEDSRSVDLDTQNFRTFCACSHFSVFSDLLLSTLLSYKVRVRLWTSEVHIVLRRSRYSKRNIQHEYSSDNGYGREGTPVFTAEKAHHSSGAMPLLKKGLQTVWLAQRKNISWLCTSRQ